MKNAAFVTKSVGELITLYFNFLSRLKIGEEIESFTVTAAVYSGEDAEIAVLFASPSLVGAAEITQQVHQGVVGVTYLITCTVETSAAQVLQNCAYLVITAV